MSKTERPPTHPPIQLLTKLLFLPLKEGVQRSAPSRMGCCGLHVYQVTHFKDTAPFTSSDESKGAEDRATLSFCHYHCYQGMDGSFFPLIIVFFYLSINNGSEEYDLSLLNLLNSSKHSPRGQSFYLVCQLLGTVCRWHCWLML